MKRALVVVFGDVSQSPRMMNHAKSLEDAGYAVDVIGYFKDVRGIDAEYRGFNYHRIPQGRIDISFLPQGVARLLNMILALLIKMVCFAWIGAFKVGKPSIIIVQNPPCLPTLLFAPLIAALHRAKYIIDWHNFSYTILALNPSTPAWLVKQVKRIELSLGKLGHVHLTVTKAMKNWLVTEARLREEDIHVLYDRPNHRFHHLSLEDKHEFLTRFFTGLDDESWGDDSPHTLVDDDGKVKMKPDNARDCALVVSSTSWTDDEDFAMLWKAILDVEQQLSKAGPRKCSLFPTIHLIITGKGPKRYYYEDLFRSQKLHFFKIKTAWLPAEDYPKLLACADLGISLHSSSSGLDIPMKIVDMLGCGLPVLAYKYETLSKELIDDEENGLLFEDADHLAQQFMDIFHGFPKSSKTLKSISENLKLKPLPAWKGHWNKIVLNGILKEE